MSTDAVTLVLCLDAEDHTKPHLYAFYSSPSAIHSLYKVNSRVHYWMRKIRRQSIVKDLVVFAYRFLIEYRGNHSDVYLFGSGIGGSAVVVLERMIVLEKGIPHRDPTQGEIAASELYSIYDRCLMRWKAGERGDGHPLNVNIRFIGLWGALQDTRASCNILSPTSTRVCHALPSGEPVRNRRFLLNVRPMANQQIEERWLPVTYSDLILASDGTRGNDAFEWMLNSFRASHPSILRASGAVAVRPTYDAIGAHSLPTSIPFPNPQETTANEVQCTLKPVRGARLQYQQILHHKMNIPLNVKILSGEVQITSDIPVASGTHSSIWLGQWLQSEKVALKGLRNIKTSNPRAIKRFGREILVWAELHHPNIQPFYGIVIDESQRMIYLVSPWQDNGNVLEYVRHNPDANRMHLISGAAKGIEYIHNRMVVHGNIKCANILVSADKEAKICDFGMSKIMEVTERSDLSTMTFSGNTRWEAPELIDGSISSPTTTTDTYSFAMTALELLTGKYPYSHRERDAAALRDIVLLKTPLRPTDESAQLWLTDSLWELMQECWRSADARPKMSEVALRIQDMNTVK